MRQYEVNGFSFYTKEEAALAELESKRVDYMQERMEYDNPLRVLSIYNKAIDEGIFQGQVGIAYLRKIQDYLWNQPDVPKDQIQPIPAGESLAILATGYRLGTFTHLSIPRPVKDLTAFLI